MSSNSPSTRGEPRAGRLLVDEPASGVARLTISNPAKRGALDHAILDAIATTVPGLDARCVIVTGEGSTFSAGYDIGHLPTDVVADEAERLIARPFAAAIAALEAYPYPTLASINGPAIGGGLELALSCDLRMASSAIVFAMPPARLGLVYSHTGLRKFIEIIGAARTRELFLLGQRIDAATAREWGMVNDVTAPEDLTQSSLGRAVQLAAGAPLAQRGNKRVISALVEAQGRLEPDVERELIELRHACFQSKDFREGVRAFAEKREPKWQGR